MSHAPGVSSTALTAAHSRCCCSLGAAEDRAGREKGTGQDKETKSCFILQLVGHYETSSFKSFPWALNTGSPSAPHELMLLQGLRADSIAQPLPRPPAGHTPPAGCKFREVLESGQSLPLGTAAVHYLEMFADIVLAQG